MCTNLSCFKKHFIWNPSLKTQKHKIVFFLNLIFFSALEFQNMKNETPKSHHKNKPPKQNKKINPVHIELGSIHK
jgi:hypothetical protein